MFATNGVRRGGGVRDADDFVSSLIAFLWEFSRDFIAHFNNIRVPLYWNHIHYLFGIVSESIEVQSTSTAAIHAPRTGTLDLVDAIYMYIYI